MRIAINKAKCWLASLSPRTGIALLIACALFYAISFTQILLPISAAAKGVLWVVFFGLAKASQYSALLILGKSGIGILRKRFLRKNIKNTN